MLSCSLCISLLYYATSALSFPYRSVSVSDSKVCDWVVSKYQDYGSYFFAVNCSFRTLPLSKIDAIVYGPPLTCET